MSVQLSVIEPLGEKMDLFGATGKTPHVVARVDAQRDIKPGMTLALHLDMRKAHIFEPSKGGANLTIELACL